MTDQPQDPKREAQTSGVNPGYAAFQIAKALTTSQEHGNAATRERAKEKISRWESVLTNILTGSVNYGSRTPVRGAPAWATLEVVTGGFATGALLAGGALQEHEKKLLEHIPGVPEGEERRALNAYFLTDAGLAELQDWLARGCYEVLVPEEGGLLVVACLVQNGYVEAARGLLDEISPYFSRLRFYPIPLQQPRQFGSRVHLQDVGKTIEDLRKIGPNPRILAQKEAVEIWAPLYDRIVAMFLETVKDDWPCQNYPDGWSERASVLLDEYTQLSKTHTLCGKMAQSNDHSAQLREFLGRCARNPAGLTGCEVGRIRLILKRYMEKRGKPNSPACVETRSRQAADVSAPAFHAIAEVVAPRLEKHAMDAGINEPDHLIEAVTEAEASIFGVPVGTAIPHSIQRKVERCINETVEVLVERGLITSGETLARVLPQMTSEIRATGITNPTLRQLYAAIYRAFRRRRSLLLLNLERQVQIEELPWIAAIEQFRSDSLSSQEIARQTLKEVAILTLTSFPQAILPNKLLQELRALVKGANLDIPLVDELAADIFMGKFSGKFVEAAWMAGDLLKGSLYATYYGINYAEIQRIPKAKETPKRTWFWQTKTAPPAPEDFARLCASRAGVSLGAWDPAINGMVIEQQQILTTQNLAALFAGLKLTGTLPAQPGELARECFRWICRVQQIKVKKWHSRLIILKNTAYAWRQMIFFLSLVPGSDVADFLRWAEAHLGSQAEDFRKRFRPALKGLMLAADGVSPDGDAARNSAARRFLGWSKEKHWLLAEL